MSKSRVFYPLFMLNRRESILYLFLLLAIAVFVWVALDFGFVQDDAYITFRYITNHLQGDGLVFNVGERIEGYTNFGWLLLLLLAALAGVDFLVFSQWAGILSGIGAILVTYLISRRCLEKDSRLWAWLPPVILAACPSFAYWSQSGLESAAFVLLMSLAIYLFLVRSWYLAPVLVAAVMVRPEGALLAFLLILAELLTTRQLPRFTTSCAVLALLFSLPFAGFKLFYYGSIFPNSFYAKTELGVEQVRSGIDYAVVFFKHYPVLVTGFLLALLFWNRLGASVRAIWLVSAGFFLYVVVIGGDVLKVHRFFLPVAGLMAVSFVAWLSTLTERLRVGVRYAIIVIFAAATLSLGYYLPHQYVYLYAALERALTDKMAFLAASMKESDPSDFDLAAGTIGRLGYELQGHRLIDLLGLTDSTIARHSEPVPAGMESTWRERSFNSPYVLSQAPDYIVFSTGLKPSAPAERALFRYNQFLDCYRGASWYYQPDEVPSAAPLAPVLRKTCEPEPPFTPVYTVEFVNWYNRGLNAYSAGRYQDADRCFREALSLGGNPPYVYLLYNQALTAFMLGDAERGEYLQNRILEIDSSVAEIHGDLYVYEYTIGNHDKAAIHRRWFASLEPWLVQRYDSVAAARYRQRQVRSPRRP